MRTLAPAPAGRAAHGVPPAADAPVRDGRRPVCPRESLLIELVVLGVGEADEGQVVARERLRGREVLGGGLVLHLEGGGRTFTEVVFNILPFHILPSKFGFEDQFN